MELSTETISVLKNYAAINANFVFKNEEYISTIAEAKNILSRYKMEEMPHAFMEREVGIYDLPEFLNAISLVDTPSFKFEDDYVNIGDSSGRSNIKYFYSSIELLTHPSESMLKKASDLSNYVVSFTLDADTLSKLRKASSALGHTDLIVTKNGESIQLTIADAENSTGNTYSLDVAGETDHDDFKLVFNIQNLKMMHGDYQVKISDKYLAYFNGAAIEYWIALEKNKTTDLSTFNIEEK